MELITKVEWTKKAEANLFKIHKNISEDAPLLAIRFTRNIISKTDLKLSTFPLCGRKVPEFEHSNLSSLREIIYKGYRIIYDPSDAPHKVSIITIISGRMDLLGHASSSWVIK